MANYSDMTLDELRLALAPEVAASAIFDGWTQAALENAAGMAGADIDVVRLAYPGGSMDMIEAWIDMIDAKMVEDMPPEKLSSMPIRERIRSLVQYRLDAVEGLEEAVRRLVRSSWAGVVRMSCGVSLAIRQPTTITIPSVRS